MDKAADATTTTRGTQADTGLAYRRMAVAHLEAAGFENPRVTLEGLYRRCLPDESEYEAEVKSLERDYREAMRKAAYFRAIEEIAGEDATAFARLYGFAADEAGAAAARRRRIRRTGRSDPGVRPAVGAGVLRALRRPPAGGP